MDSLQNKSLNFSDQDKEEDSPEKLNINTTDSTINVKNPKRIVNPDKNHQLLKLT
jgi:hypothetical protein